MTNHNLETKTDKVLFCFTVPVVILIVICSSTGIWYQKLYARETMDLLSQCIGQDISNLFFVAPILLIAAFFVLQRNRIAKMIWLGTMITNIYAYMIYCFAVHFNFLFHVYCVILGLSIYSVIYFFMTHMKEDFRNWYTEKVPVKTIGTFLMIIAVLFVFLWLSQSLPAAIANTVPESILNDGLLTNPVHVLDFSFYLPLMFISAVMLMKKKALGYLLAPMMLIFAVITNLNIISLTFVTMEKTSSNNLPLIICFSIFTIVCVGFLWLMLKNILKSTIKEVVD